MPSILPTHLPTSPNPPPGHPHPTPLPFPAHSPSAPTPLPPSPLLPELVHLLPCLLIQPTCSLVSPSTRQLARYSSNLFICYPVSSRHQLVPLSTPQPVNLQCYSSNLFICYPVSSRHQPVPLSPFSLSSYPVNTIYYPLILPLLVNYFYHLTFLSVLV